MELFKSFTGVHITELNFVLTVPAVPQLLRFKGPLSLTWFNFIHSMDKKSYAK